MSERSCWTWSELPHTLGLCAPSFHSQERDCHLFINHAITACRRIALWKVCICYSHRNTIVSLRKRMQKDLGGWTKKVVKNLHFTPNVYQMSPQWREIWIFLTSDSHAELTRKKFRLQIWLNPPTPNVPRIGNSHGELRKKKIWNFFWRTLTLQRLWLVSLV